MSETKGLTELQRRLVFMSCNEAARELCMPAEDYRHKVMKEELGKTSLTQCNRTGDFDKLMQRIWSDRGDYSRALEYVGGDTKRLAYLATEAAKTILIQKGVDPADENFTTNALRYVATVLIQMKLSRETLDSLTFRLKRVDGWDDFSPIRLKSVVSALQAHIRRKS